jgi:hypothetical protein
MMLLSKTTAGTPMGDILQDLKDWHDQLVKDTPHLTGLEDDKKLLKRAIAEIERLRAAQTAKGTRA